MARKFVRLLADVHCKWQGLSPIYRAYVNDELFAERTWIWTDCYLRECLQIEAEPVNNMRVGYGPATIDNNILRISDATV